jgi:hypothetical protein
LILLHRGPRNKSGVTIRLDLLSRRDGDRIADLVANGLAGEILAGEYIHAFAIARRLPELTDSAFFRRILHEMLALVFDNEDATVLQLCRDRGKTLP